MKKPSFLEQLGFSVDGTGEELAKIEVLFTFKQL